MILSTVTSVDAMAAVFSVLRPRGRLLVVGVSMDPIGVMAAMLIGGSHTIAGHARAPRRISRTRYASACSATCGQCSLLQAWPELV